MSSANRLAAMIRARSANAQPAFIASPTGASAAPSFDSVPEAAAPTIPAVPSPPPVPVAPPAPPAPPAVPPVQAARPAPPAPAPIVVARAPSPPPPVQPTVARGPSPTPAARDSSPPPAPRPVTPTGPSGDGDKPKYVPKVVAFSGAPKCAICMKTVYKMEEIIALGEHWHATCFTCGGKNQDGCGKVLNRDGYLDHGGQPYCNACYSKLFRPKGFGYGNSLSTDYGPSPADVRSASPPKEPIPAVPSRGATTVVSPSAPAQASVSQSSPVKSSQTSFSKPAPPVARSVPTAAAPAPARAPSPPPAPKHMAPPPPKHAPTIVSIETMKAQVAVEKEVEKSAGPSGAASSSVSASVPAAGTSVVSAATVPAPTYTPTNNTTVQSKDAPKCTMCAKTVYKMEEVIAVGRVWHDKCFTCGGSAGDGCGKVLKRAGYVDHANQPYCTPCHNRMFGPKGFGYGNTLTSTGLTADMANVNISADSGSSVSAPAPAAPAAKRSGSIIGAIGGTSRAPKETDLYKEASYVGNDDEVDESEW